MPAINADTVDFWRQLARDLDPQRPIPGRRVRITGGRKHVGKIGEVTRHMRSRYSSDRYRSEAALHMRDMAGREGFVVLVQPNDGAPAFWVRADYVEVGDFSLDAEAVE